MTAALTRSSYVETFQFSAVSTFLREMTSRPPSWSCDVISKARLRQSSRIYSFLPISWSRSYLKRRSLGFFLKRSPPTRTRSRRITEWVAIWDQFLV